MKTDAVEVVETEVKEMTAEDLDLVAGGFVNFSFY